MLEFFCFTSEPQLTLLHYNLKIPYIPLDLSLQMNTLLAKAERLCKSQSLLVLCLMPLGNVTSLGLWRQEIEGMSFLSYALLKFPARKCM